MRALPIILSDSTSFPINLTVGSPNLSQVTLNAARLVNTYREPIRIREFNWAVEEQANAALTASTHGIAMAALQAKISMAGRGITQDFIPVGSMGVVVQAPSFVGVNTRTTLPQVAATGTMRSEFYRWVLPQPLDMDPGQAFSVVIQLDPSVFAGAFPQAGGAASYNLGFSALGTLGDVKTSRVRPVPYISGAVYGPASGRLSDPTDFNNPFAVALQVQRLFSFRQNMYGSPAFLTDTRRIRLRAPGGYAMVRDPTDEDMVLFKQRHTWEVNVALRNADDFFSLELVDAIPADVAGTTAERLTVNMVGSRLERF